MPSKGLTGLVCMVGCAKAAPHEFSTGGYIPQPRAALVGGWLFMTSGSGPGFQFAVTAAVAPPPMNAKRNAGAGAKRSRPLRGSARPVGKRSCRSGAILLIARRPADRKLIATVSLWARRPANAAWVCKAGENGCPGRGVVVGRGRCVRGQFASGSLRRC